MKIGERAGMEPPPRCTADGREIRDNSAISTRMYLAARRHFDAHQLFDRLVPGHVVGHRRNVVHAVGDQSRQSKTE